MRLPLALRVVTRLLAWLLPKNLRESLLGDLTEEYARRKAVSPSAALRWYLRQVCASVTPLLWLSLTRAVWLSTMAVAILAFFAIGGIQMVIRWAIAGSSGVVHNILDLLLVFPVVVVTGYFAERLRPRSAIVLGVIMLLTVTAMSLGANGNAPLWYRMAWFLIGPAACIGGALRSSRRASR